MTDTLKVLGQQAPGAVTLTDLYAVPAATSATVSSLTVANQSASATTFRISVAVAGAADTSKQYLYYDVPLAGNDTFVATLGLTLATTDVIRCYAGAATVSFQVFGVQVT